MHSWISTAPEIKTDFKRILGEYAIELKNPENSCIFRYKAIRKKSTRQRD